MDYPAQEMEELFWGPASAEFLKFREGAKEVDIKKFAPEVEVIPHYKLTDNPLVFSSFSLRGFYECRNFPFEENDIIVTSFPKTGTTWIQEIVYFVINYDHIDRTDLKTIDIRFPFMEFPELRNHTEIMKCTPSPRLIKSHLPFSLLPLGNCNRNYKIIYICRNPKDTVVSMYHFYKMMISLGYKGGLQEFVNLFVNDCLLYSPFWKHVCEFWEHRNDKNVLFLKYEDLHKDLKGAIKQTAEFLGVQLAEEQISKIATRCTFGEMASNPASNRSNWHGVHLNPSISKFMRKGQVGNWKCHLDAEMNRLMDAWIESNSKDSDLVLEYE